MSLLIRIMMIETKSCGENVSEIGQQMAILSQKVTNCTLQFLSLDNFTYYYIQGYNKHEDGRYKYIATQGRNQLLITHSS